MLVLSTGGGPERSGGDVGVPVRRVSLELECLEPLEPRDPFEFLLLSLDFLRSPDSPEEPEAVIELEPDSLCWLVLEEPSACSRTLTVIDDFWGDPVATSFIELTRELLELVT